MGQTPDDRDPGEAAGETGGGEGPIRRERRIGRFRFLRLIGSGGQGEVYEAVDERLQRRVALKLLSRRTDFLDPETSRKVRARFEREAEVAARLEHPGICAVHEMGEDEGLPWIAMRLVEGDSLQTLIARSRETQTSDPTMSEVSFAPGEEAPTSDAQAGRRRTPSESSSSGPAKAQMLAILELIESAARALHAAHEVGLVHRDVKPGNLMVTPEGRAVVLDFGLASDEQATGPTLTMTGDFLGTPAYMAPEQIAAQRVRVDRRTDVYALGVTLFECLSLRRPFEAASREALYRDILGREAPDLRRLNPAVPRDLATVVQHALEKHPDRRYQTALELAEDLRRVREREPIRARPVGPVTKLVRWGQRNPAVAALLGALLLVLISASGFTAFKNRQLSELNTELSATNLALETKTREAQENAEEARANERRAEAESAEKTEALEREQEAREAESRALAEKTAALSEYERMADTRRLLNARSAADALWPEHPDIVPALEAWQTRYAPLFGRLEGHREALEALREKAPPYTEAERARDFAAELSLIARLEEDLRKLREQLAAVEDAEQKTTGERAAAKLESELSELRATVRGRRSWDYGEDVDTQFRHDTLARLVADLEASTAEGTGVQSSVARRLERSRRIRKETLEDRAGLWADTCSRIASNPRYGGLTLRPQLGLIPLGPDPSSGLEEFLDWRTHDWTEDEGALPGRGEDGRIAMTETRGLIFVLIPGGSFLMGAQRDPEQPNFDPDAGSGEAPVREVVLSAYLISKYEMTQGQWSRFDGENPSQYGPGWFNPQALPAPVDLRHPVEQVSWEDCTSRLEHLVLELPTEAQWERAARAGADPATVWTGTSDLAELSRFANTSGEESAAFFSNRTAGHRDAFVSHAPAGSFAANAFGLFDMTGNVWEWCRDAFAGYESDPSPGDGLRRSASRSRVGRGGSFLNPAVYARLANRITYDPTLRNNDLGLRPSRSITNE